MKKIYDCIIIGAGVTGAATAYNLSRYKGKFLVLDKENDVCEGTSKANSAIIHAGFDAPSGTLMAELNVKGSQMMEELAKTLNIPYKRNGAMVVAKSESERPRLDELLERGRKNGVRDLRIIEKDEIRKIEGNISPDVALALYAPTSAIICPFTLTYALSEVAAINGVNFAFNKRVIGITKTDGIFRVCTEDQSEYYSKVVINASGVYADVIHNMVSKDKATIVPRKGEYMVLDRSVGNFVKHTIFPLPTAMGKGILVTPTIHGNVLLGPTAKDTEDKDNTETTTEGLETIKNKCKESMKDVPLSKVITSFAGLRAHDVRHQFTIEENKDVKGFIDVMGIESPGLSSAPAIGEMVSEIVLNILPLKANPRFKNERKPQINPRELSRKEYKKLVLFHPEYAKIVCRCHKITKGEILDCINRPVGATTILGIKKRTTALMGACQGSFCLPEITNILNEALSKKKRGLHG